MTQSTTLTGERGQSGKKETKIWRWRRRRRQRATNVPLCLMQSANIEREGAGERTNVRVRRTYGGNAICHPYCFFLSLCCSAMLAFAARLFNISFSWNVRCTCVMCIYGRSSLFTCIVHFPYATVSVCMGEQIAHRFLLCRLHTEGSSSSSSMRLCRFLFILSMFGFLMDGERRMCDNDGYFRQTR